MSDFKAKMHKIRFPLGLGPEPAGGAYSAPPAPWVYLRGLLLRVRRKKRERGREEGKGRRREEERKGWEKGEKGRGQPTQIFWHRTGPDHVNVISAYNRRMKEQTESL